MQRKPLLTAVLVAGALALVATGCTKKTKNDQYEGKVKADEGGSMTSAGAPGAMSDPGYVAPAGKNPRVAIKTSLGNILVELNAAKAPISVKNFLGYVDAKFYDGTIFHRVIPNFMIQGGGFTTDKTKKPTRAPIKNEADNGLSNTRYTLAMARTRLKDSATAQFFINVKNSPHLDHQGPGPRFGYAVFGRVVQGQDVVEKIRYTPTKREGMLTHLPVKPVVILQARRVK